MEVSTRDAMDLLSYSQRWFSMPKVPQNRFAQEDGFGLKMVRKTTAVAIVGVTYGKKNNTRKNPLDRMLFISRHASSIDTASYTGIVPST